MHRSGTSTLAGTLRKAGVHFGKVLDASFTQNPKGLNEAPAVLFMHQNLLETSGGDWHDPPENVVWQKLHKAVRDLFVESRADQPIWAFKDPRTLITLDGWLDVLPHLECVGIFRHPGEVAMSIHLRNEFSLEKGFEIWLSYNERLLRYKKERGFPVIEFVSDPGRMTRSLSALLRHLGLDASSDAMSFYDAGMKNHDKTEVEMPSAVEAVYTALQEEAL